MHARRPYYSTNPTWKRAVALEGWGWLPAMPSWFLIPSPQMLVEGLQFEAGFTVMVLGPVRWSRRMVYVRGAL